MCLDNHAEAIALSGNLQAALYGLLLVHKGQYETLHQKLQSIAQQHNVVH